MWDNTQALRQLANSLFGVSLLLLLFGTLHYMVHMPDFSLNVVQLTAPPQRVDPALIGDIVSNELRGNFFTLDIEEVRKEFEKLPWVRKVSVRRHFPWMLEVEIEEHEALAHWNNEELVNTHGEIFSAESEQVLPRFIGQAETATEVTQMYKIFGDQLAPLNQKVVQISLSPRRAWQLRLNNGMVLELGREQAQERLARFVAIYPTSLASLGRTINYVDLRYKNGFAANLPGGVSGGQANQG
jgi:cell division protein FtsQ